MSSQLHVEVEPVKSVSEAVREMDIVVTSGPVLKEPTPTIEGGWLAEGGFASLLDFDCYWKRDAFRAVSKFATDDLTQMRYYRGQGYFRDVPEPYADLGEIVAGMKPGRSLEGEKTMTVNLGLGLEDIATALLVYNKAREKEIGLDLPL